MSLIIDSVVHKEDGKTCSFCPDRPEDASELYIRMAPEYAEVNNIGDGDTFHGYIQEVKDGRGKIPELQDEEIEFIMGSRCIYETSPENIVYISEKTVQERNFRDYGLIKSAWTLNVNLTKANRKEDGKEIDIFLKREVKAK